MRLKEEFRNETVINKSRFIACVKPCRTEEECRAYIEEIRSEYSDATHVCTAYVTGENDRIQRSSDNKEPGGTAGVPMLEAIRHSGISSVCACVVRYFGGIKFGAGGLIRAYSGAVTEALAKAQKTIDVTYHEYRIDYVYELSGLMEGWLRKYTEVIDQQFDEKVHMFVLSEEELNEKIRNISKGKAEIAFLKDVIREKDAEQ